jgi:transmembrane protease serine 9
MLFLGGTINTGRYTVIKRLVVYCVVLIFTSPSFAQNTATATQSGASIRALDPKIIGGSPSRAGARPWQVALVYANDANNYSAHFCGGTVIGEKEILTAAHCVEGKLASQIRVLSGTQSLRSGGVRSVVAQIITHPAYDKESQDSDLAILRLSTSPLGRSIMEISPQEELEYSPPNAAATVIGWGNTQSQGQSFPAELLEVRVPVVPLQTCYERYKKDGIAVTDNMLCAGYKTGGKDSCQGDSGGPLIVDVERGGKIGVRQIGVVSWGVGCALPENYGVYTRLSRFSTWISANVPKRCTPDDVQGGIC